jgi:hypothetical protein
MESAPSTIKTPTIASHNQRTMFLLRAVQNGGAGE